MSGDTQDEPIQDQHSFTDDDMVAGILVQHEADLAGHEEAEVLDALRERLTDGGHEMTDEVLREHAHRIAGLKPNKYSQQ